MDPDDSISEAGWNGDIPAIRRELDRGASVDQGNSGGWTALLYAAYKGHLETVCFLVMCGAKVDLSAQLDGSTPLAQACQRNHADVALYLIQQNANVNQRSTGDSTPLMEAMSTESRDCIKLLLEHKAVES